MNPHHKKILNEIKRNSPEKQNLNSWVSETYLGSKHLLYGLNAAALRSVVKDWYKDNKTLEQEEITELLNSLNKGNSFEEKVVVGTLLNLYSFYRKNMDITLFDKWLENVFGWAEIDSLCQSSFSGKEVLERWSEWERLLKNLNENGVVAKRRASLVLLVRPVREENNDLLKVQAFESIDRLKHEKDILITKAISWLLREMTKRYTVEVKEYLEENENTLPKIAVRETKRKLETGKK